MRSDQKAKYPDFLLEFENIKALSDWQQSAMQALDTQMDSLLKMLKMSFSAGEIWQGLVYDTIGQSRADAIKLLHRRFDVTTFEVLKNYMHIWLPEHKSKIEYDKDTLTVKVQVVRDTDNAVRRKLTRDILPCNLKLEYEAVAELS